MKIKAISFFEKYNLYLIIFVYFLLALTNLMKFPIFNDEALYIDWSNRIRIGASPIFYSLYDGKPPFLLWVISVFMRVIPDPLLAGRLVSVLAGALSVLGLYKVAYLISGKKLAIITSVVFVTSSLFLFYERQALHESGLIAISVWSFYSLLRFINEYKYRYAFSLGALVGLGFFIKPSFIIYMLPLALAIFLSYIRQKEKQNKTYIGGLIIVFVFLITILPLIVQKDAYLMFSRNDRYGLTINELLSFPLKVWINNIKNLFEIYFWHLTPFIFLTFAVGVVILFKKARDLKYLTLILWTYVSIFLVVFISRGLLARYILPFSWGIILTSALGFLFLYRKFKGYVYILIIFPILFSIYQISDQKAYLTSLDRFTKTSDANVYLAGFPSGYGVDSAVEFIKEKGKAENIIVAVRVDAGNPESAIMAYFLGGRYKNITPAYFDGRFIQLPLPEDFIGYNYPFYFVARDNNLSGLNDYFVEVKRFYKPDGVSFVGIYKLEKKDGKRV